MCNDKEHLLFFVEMGCVEFCVSPSRIKSIEYPDYALIAIDYADLDQSKALAIMHLARRILDGLKLPSLVKIASATCFQIYIPLDAKSHFDKTRTMAAYICKLIKLKMPDDVSLKGTDRNDYGKITLDYLMNEHQALVVAPYSLIVGDQPVIAVPLSWEEIGDELAIEKFDLITTLKRIQKQADPLAAVLKKKINADATLTRMEENYSFLF